MPLAMLASFVAGALGWTVAEYLLHRFAGHGHLRRRPGRWWWVTPRVLAIAFHEEHVAHHRDPGYFAPRWKKALAAAAAVPVLGGAAALLVGLAAGLAFGAGFAAAYLAYERLHRRIHTHPPTNRYLRWMRRHHLHHHVAPRRNHGVTSDLWDRVLGTLDRPRTVVLPRSLAPPWLVDAGTGALRPEFGADYELAGRGGEGRAQGR
jgi:sterol desaturase/sphingolipid hydroxylase (fatty acid hydroxylase superfamily)